MNMFTLVCCIMYTIMHNYCIKLFTVPYYFFYCSFVLFVIVYIFYLLVLFMYLYGCAICVMVMCLSIHAHDMVHLWKSEEGFQKLNRHCLGTTGHT